MKTIVGALLLVQLLAVPWSVGAQTPPAQWVEHLGFNVARPPLDNVILRQAVASAIDRQAVFDAARSKYTRGITISAPAGSWFPPVLPQYSPDVRIHPYNLAVARELMTKAAFPNGRGLPEFELVYRSDMAYRQAEAEVLSMQLAAIGLKVKPVGIPGRDAFFRRVVPGPGRQGDFLMAVFAWGNPSRGSEFLSDMFLQGGPQNAYGYRNPDVTLLIADILKESDAVKRLEKIREAERLVLTDAPVVPLLYYYVAP